MNSPRLADHFKATVISVVSGGHCQLTHSSLPSFIHMLNLGHADERERKKKPTLLWFTIIKIGGHEEPHVHVTMARGRN